MGKAVRKVSKTEKLQRVNTIKLCKSLGTLVLENGGEIYRAEDMVRHAWQASGMAETNVLVIPTGIVISTTDEEGEEFTAMVSIRRRGVDLTKVDAANDISYRYSTGKITLEEAVEQAEAIYCQKPRNPLLTAAAAGLCVAFLSGTLGGGWFEFLLTAVCGFCIQYTAFYIRKVDMYSFLISLVGSAIAAGLAVLFTELFQRGTLNIIISSSIMILIPGAAMVNAIRDTVHGDLVSGVARAGEVAIIALSIAAGAGSVLSFYKMAGGSL